MSAVRVDLSPANGAPGRRMSIKASGFTTGKTLWAHVTKGKSKRTLKVGRLSGACGGLKTRRRLLPQNAALRPSHDPVRHVQALQPEAAGPLPLHDRRGARLAALYGRGWPVRAASGVWPGIGSVVWSNSFAS